MSRAAFIVRHNGDRDRICHMVKRVPPGTRVEFKLSRRSIPQNDRMWAMLTDVAHQLAWHGQKLRADDWKLVFLDALKRELRVVPNIDNNGFVNLGRHSSDLTKHEMSDLMEIIAKFGAEHGVVFGGPEEDAA